jgi:S1-C subfamily serine protease
MAARMSITISLSGKTAASRFIPMKPGTSEYPQDGKMSKITASLLSALLLTVCAQAFAADNPRAEFEERRRAVAARMEAATVWVVGEDDESIATGSGFIVGEGLVVTNSHVVDELGRGKVIYVLNDALPAAKAHIVAMVHDEKTDAVGGRDFALLRFAPPKGVTLPALTFNLEARRMDRVSAWGYPSLVTQFDSSTARLQEGDTRGLKAPPVVYTEGAINSIVNDRLGASIIHSASIAGGNSGGPLVNGRGEVVGINTWGYKEEDEGAFVNAAQPAPAIAAFLAENGVTPKFAEGQQLTARPGNSPRMRTPEEPAKPDRSGWEQKTAEGGRRDVGSFSVLVPRGWSVVDEEKDMILLGSNDRATSWASCSAISRAGVRDRLRRRFPKNSAAHGRKWKMISLCSPTPGTELIPRSL